MNNLILFLGKWDNSLVQLENNILGTDLKLECDEMPDFLNKQIDDIDYYYIKGDVVPTFLLKETISTSKILIFSVNLSNPSTINYLNKDGWGYIIEKTDRPKNQERYIVAYNADKNKNTELVKLIDDLGCNKYFEEPPCTIFPEFIKEDLKPDNYNFKKYLEAQLQKIKGANNKNEEDNELEKLDKEGSGQISSQISKDDQKCKIKEEEKIEIQEFREEEETTEAEDDYTETCTDPSYFEYSLSMKKGTAKLTRFTNGEKSDEVTVPRTAEYSGSEFKIIKICDGAFSNTKIAGLVFDEGTEIKSIGDSVFDKCLIKSLSIPPSLTNLGKFWCRGADYLEKIQVSKGNSHFYMKKEFLFYKKETEIDGQLAKSEKILFSPRSFKNGDIIPKGVTELGSFAFFGRKWISSVTCKCPSVEEAGKSQSKKKGTKPLSPVFSVGDSCFESCSSLLSATIENVPKVVFGPSSFKGCRRMYGISLPEISIAEFGPSCFSGDSKIDSIEFNLMSLTIGEKCFENCSSLKTFSFPIMSEESNNLPFETIKKDSKLIAQSECFIGMSNLKAILIKCEEVQLGE